MASVEKRAAGYVAKTKSAGAVPYSAGKSASRTKGPVGTVASLNQGVLKGPTARGN